MRGGPLALALVAVGIISVLIGVYYLIPGIDHLFATPAGEIHVKHALAFFALAVVALLGSRFVGSSSRG